MLFKDLYDKNTIKIFQWKSKLILFTYNCWQICVHPNSISTAYMKLLKPQQWIDTLCDDGSTGNQGSGFLHWTICHKVINALWQYLVSSPWRFQRSTMHVLCYSIVLYSTTRSSIYALKITFITGRIKRSVSRSSIRMVCRCFRSLSAKDKTFLATSLL